MVDRWHPGDVIALRDIWRGRIWFAVPVVVVKDDPGRSMFYRAARSPCRRPVSRSDGRPLRLPSEPWDLVTAGRERHDALSFAWPNVGFSVLLFWDNAWDNAGDSDRHGGFAGWYVNLQSPLRRTAYGFDYTDHVLDIVVEPDRSWSWRDEDALDEAVELGSFTPLEARAIRAEGERAIERLERREEPFDGRWLDWRPDPGWAIPALGSRWDVV